MDMDHSEPNKYNFSMSKDDQEYFLSIERNAKYGELLRKFRSKDNGKQSVDFKEQSSSKFVLSQVDKKIMLETINAFPIDLQLNSKSIYQYPKSQTDIQTNLNRIYDIRFMMPLLYHAVSPSLFVDCRDFIARRCLALSITGLSSEDPQMRALSYAILERYYTHLQSALLIDAKLWINLLDLLRNSIPSANARLRYIFTTFLCRIIDVLLHPEKDKLYELIKEFLAGRPRLNIDTIEIYDDLLLCSDVDLYKYNLRWLVTLFRDGLKSKNDLKVLNNLSFISQIMCLYNSELRFDRANETICSVFIKITSIPTGSQLLVSNHSFLPWLHQIILYHINQDLEEMKNDHKMESLTDTAKSLSSLVFGIIDSLLIQAKGNSLKDCDEDVSACRADAESLPLPVLLEMISVFVVLHDLIIKSKSASILEYYLNYVKIVFKAIRKNCSKISDEMSFQLMQMILLKLNYLV